MQYQPVKIYTDASQIITFQKHNFTVKRVVLKSYDRGQIALNKLH
jgi:hypothetical protein